MASAQGIERLHALLATIDAFEFPEDKKHAMVLNDIEGHVNALRQRAETILGRIEDVEEDGTFSGDEFSQEGL